MEERENNKLVYKILPEAFPHYDLSFKIILLGDANVGKNDFEIKSTKKKFENDEFFSFNMKIGNKIIRLQIWGSRGQERYRSLITPFYKNTSLAIIIYAINE